MSDNNLLSKINAGFRPMSKALPLRFFIVLAPLLFIGVILASNNFVLGWGLAACSLIVALPGIVISLQRIHDYEKQYLEGLSQNELMALIGKDMSYQSKFSTALVLQTLDRRFPNWRQSSV